VLLARALVGDPAILLLDEATSALDNVSQATVLGELAKLAATRLVIAHRLSTVRDADRIVVLDAGRIVQAGTFEELSEQRGGLFAAMLARQRA
jgi:ABC-type multidrug transport system fused ATPase/permease subunit